MLSLKANTLDWNKWRFKKKKKYAYMYALNAEKKMISNYSLSFLRKVCI